MNHADLAPGCMDADPESRELAVVEDPVSALDRERLDDPLVQLDGALSRHAPLPHHPVTERIAARDCRRGGLGRLEVLEQPDTDRHSTRVYQRQSVAALQAPSRACRKP